MPLSATDPTAYETIACGTRTRLKCLDCGRYGDFDAGQVAHARNCDLVGARGKLVGPAVNTPKTDTVAAAHEAGVCTWTKVGGVWAVTGPEAALRSGTVLVQAKGKQPEQIMVGGARQDGARWIAFKANPVADPYDSFLSGSISASAAMNSDF